MDLNLVSIQAWHASTKRQNGPRLKTKYQNPSSQDYEETQDAHFRD